MVPAESVDRRFFFFGGGEGEGGQLSNKLIQQTSFGCSLLDNNVTSHSPELFYFNCLYNFGSYLQKNMFSYLKFPLVLTVI